MSSILIQNAHVVTMDSQRRIIKDGAVFAEGNKIVAVGESDDVSKKYVADKVINARGKALLPGLVNAHNHPWYVLTKGLGTDKSVIDWLNSCIHVMAPNLKANDFYMSGLLSNVEAIKSGATTNVGYECFYLREMPEIADMVIRSYRETGVRCIYGRGMFDASEDIVVPSAMMEDTKSALSHSENLIRKYNKPDSTMVRVWVAPTSILTSTTDLLLGCRELATKYQTGLMIHVAESQDFNKHAERHYGMGEVQYLAKIGLLGPDVLAAHCSWLSDRDVRTFRDKAVKVVHNPTTNMMIADGIANVPKYLEAGIVVGLGTDDAGSNGNNDMISVLKHAALLHKVTCHDPSVITAEKILEMATIDGARCLGLENEIGSIETGKKADLILVNLHNPHIAPANSVSQALVYGVTSECVDTTIIDGKIVMEGRRINTVDEDRVVNQACRAADELVVASNLTHFRDRPWTTVAY